MAKDNLKTLLDIEELKKSVSEIQTSSLNEEAVITIIEDNVLEAIAADTDIAALTPIADPQNTSDTAVATLLNELIAILQQDPGEE